VKVELFKKVLGEVKSRLGEVSEYNQALTLVKIWQATKEMEDLEKAWEIAQQKSYFEIQVEIVKSLALENLEKALEKAQEISEKHWRDIAYLEIVKSLAKNKGKTQAVFKVISLIEDKYHKALALLEIGQIEEALKIANNLGVELKIKLLILIGKITGKKKYLGSALRLIKIHKPQSKNQFLKEIAVTFGKMGNYRKAREIAMKIDKERLKLETLCEIEAESYDDFNLNVLSFQIRQIESLVERSELFRYLARVLAQAERWERALETAEKIPLLLEREETLREVAEIMAERKLIWRAEQLLKQIKTPSIRVQALIKLLKFSKESEKLENLYFEIQKIENTKSKIHALAEFLKVLSDLGRRP
jgi:tetratricopeptide (TPR) repeat protein